MMRRCFALLLILTNNLSAGAQGGSVPQPGIAQMQAANAGKIVFSAKELSPASYSGGDLLHNYRFTPKSSLYFTAFFAHSLTHELQAMLPTLTVDEIEKFGCYQFSFYVDNRLVYTDDLHPGSLFPKQKHEGLYISRPFVSHPFPNWWSAYLWYRFSRHGGDSALVDGKHLLKIEMRPYIKNPSLTVGKVVAAGELLLNVQTPKIDPASMLINKPKPYNDLSVSAAPFDREKIRMLLAKEQENFFKDITSVVVLKEGKILIEEYFNHATRNTLHDVRSVGKSFASTMTGIAIAEGHLNSEGQTLREFYNLKDFSNYSPLKENTSIKDLLTMSSPFDGNDDNSNSPGNEENMYPTSDWVKFTLHLPIDTANTDGHWHYFTAGVVLLGDILHKSVPGGLEKYADTKLFKPLGISNYKWQYTPQQVANTAGGIQMNSLDFAKYAQLYKNGGIWKGKQVLPKAWIEKTFTKHKVIPGRNNEYYGYLFWNYTYHVNGRDYETFYCAGNGGNHIYIFKDLPIVVVVTASAYNRGYAHPQVHALMQDYILPAVINAK
jgi:CubicO group peptidase (beta-lactamase class C family)